MKNWFKPAFHDFRRKTCEKQTKNKQLQRHANRNQTVTFYTFHMTWFDKLIVSIISLMWNETNVELKYNLTLALLEFFVLPKGVEMLKGKSRPFQRFLCLFSFPRSVWSKITDLPPFLSWGRYGSTSTNKHCHCRWKCRFVTWPRVMFSFSGELCVFYMDGEKMIRSICSDGKCDEDLMWPHE